MKADGLSTALFVIGKERALEYWRANPDFDAILIEENGTVTITGGLEDSFSLYGNWTGKPLEIAQR